jgi:hypothetical protein
MDPQPYMRVLVPSRGRPETVVPLAKAFNATCRATDSYLTTTILTFVVDDDDPALRAYQAAVAACEAARVEHHPWDRWPSHDAILPPETSLHVVVQGGPNRGMVLALNLAASHYTRPRWAHPPYAIGFMGDDHRPRTPGWDVAYLEALQNLGTGIVYGDDKIQGPNLPTQVAVTSDIVTTLGQMGPSALRHLYLDNYWLELGRETGCITYLPKIVVEHVHPVAGKAPMDDGYRRVNELYSRDEAAFDTYRRERLAHDIAAVRRLRETSPQ